jgi:TonB family protein
MRIFLTGVVFMISFTALSFGQKKGFCPPVPEASAFKTKNSPSPPPAAGAKSIAVTVLTLVSDTGYVCDASVLNGVEKDIDKVAVQAVRSWRFKPARKDGRDVPVVITVKVNFEKGKDGKFYRRSADSPATPNDAPKTQ